MDTPKFAITEEGQVYCLREHGRPILLGRISCLIREETPLGREVRAWWRARLASNEPAENLVVANGEDEPHFVQAPETVAIIGSQPDQEAAEARLAAD